MLLTKFDLYKTEWLDLVFTNRNKSYGAYELRQSYSKTMTKAMSIAFTLVAVGIMAFTLTKKPVVIEKPLIGPDDRTILVDLVNPPKIEKPIEPTKPVELPKTPPSAKAEAVKTTVIPTKVTSDPVPDEPPTADEIAKSAIGTEKSDGKESPGNAPAGKPDGSDTGTGTTVGTDDNTVYGTFSPLERMPEPVGGQQAWTKFLQRNLRYPAEADGVSGKVFISFIIEKDGRLSDITVLRGGEHGFGNEALRVFKKAAAWTPGIQNGRPVRVKYVIPINFQQPE